MAEKSAEGAEVSARILYWGAEGAGTSTNLVHVHRKLRSDHRGPLKQHPTALDPTVTWESLPITLGELGGVKVHLKVMAAPGAAEHAPTRKQLLDRVDGIVLVIDSSPDRLDANLEAFEELRRSLTAYGRSLEDVALVVQYNKRDLADDFSLEELHRKLDLRDAPVFETIASEGKGVLQALTTISKRVIRRLREREFGAPVPEPKPSTPPISEPATSVPDLEPEPIEGAPAAIEPVQPSPAPLHMPSVDPENTPVPGSVEEALAAEKRDPEEARLAAQVVEATEAFLDPGFAEHNQAAAPAGLEIETLGAPQQTHARGFAIPVTLRDGEGRTFAMTVRVQLDPAEEDLGD
jgi:signal recognition particle receptor subunit beta